MHEDGASAEQRYLDWYMWARAKGMPEQACHGAAGAAVKTEDAGGDSAQAAVAGAIKAERQDIDPPASRRELCNWCAWAVEDQKLPPGRALAVAHAAVVSVERGMTRSTGHGCGACL